MAHDKIPDDVWQAALEIDIWFGDGDRGRYTGLVARAIMNERERCARLIENPNRSVLGINEDALAFFAEAMASMIRSGVHAAPPHEQERPNAN